MFRQRKGRLPPPRCWSAFYSHRICSTRRSQSFPAARGVGFYLLSVLMLGANVLILDEPSNNVDIPTLTILEDYINSFSGIVITVSHDRYFLDNIVDRIFEFDGRGHLQQYEGGYTDYLEAKQRRSVAAETAVSQKAPVESAKGLEAEPAGEIEVYV